MMFIVYELWNPITNTCFYVGKGNTKRSRLPDHLRQAKYLREGKTTTDHNTLKAGTICKIQDAGYEPEYRVVIMRLAATGRKLTLATRQKISEVQKGKTLTKEHRDRISDGCRGKVRSEETKQRMRDANLGKKLSDSHKINMSVSRKGVPWTEARWTAQNNRSA